MDALRSIAADERIWFALATVSAVLFASTLLAIPWLVARLDRDHFVGPAPPNAVPPRSRMWGLAVLVVRNLVGATLVIAGIAMLVLPGQGILTLLIGLAVARFPGKRRLEKRLARQKHVRRSLDWLRRRAGRPVFRFDDDAPQPDAPPPSAVDE